MQNIDSITIFELSSVSSPGWSEWIAARLPVFASQALFPKTSLDVDLRDSLARLHNISAGYFTGLVQNGVYAPDFGDAPERQKEQLEAFPTLAVGEVVDLIERLTPFANIGLEIAARYKQMADDSAEIDRLRDERKELVKNWGFADYFSYQKWDRLWSLDQRIDQLDDRYEAARAFEDKHGKSQKNQADAFRRAASGLLGNVSGAEKVMRDLVFAVRDMRNDVAVPVYNIVIAAKSRFDLAEQNQVTATRLYDTHVNSLGQGEHAAKADAHVRKAQALFGEATTIFDAALPKLGLPEGQKPTPQNIFYVIAGKVGPLKEALFAINAVRPDAHRMVLREKESEHADGDADAEQTIIPPARDSSVAEVSERGDHSRQHGTRMATPADIVQGEGLVGQTDDTGVLFVQSAEMEEQPLFIAAYEEWADYRPTARSQPSLLQAAA